MLYLLIIRKNLKIKYQIYKAVMSNFKGYFYILSTGFYIGFISPNKSKFTEKIQKSLTSLDILFFLGF